MAGNHKELLLASAARTATPADVPLSIREESGVMIVIDVTAQALAGALRPQFLVPGESGALSMFAQGAAVNDVTAVGAWSYFVYPMGLEVAPTLAGTGFRERMSFSIPSPCFLRILHGNANSQTYSVRAYYLP